jgi:hypothetical protein
LGIGGDVLVVDDPHNVAQAESEAERETVSNWWSELSTTRLVHLSRHSTGLPRDAR